MVELLAWEVILNPPKIVVLKLYTKDGALQVVGYQIFHLSCLSYGYTYQLFLCMCLVHVM